MDSQSKQNTEKVTEIEFTVYSSEDTLNSEVVVPGSDNVFP